MTFQQIILLNFAAVLEGIIMYYLIQHQLVVCKLPGINGVLDVMAFVGVKNIITLGVYQLYFWPQRNHNPAKKIYLQPTALDRWIPALPWSFWLYAPCYYLVFSVALLCLNDINITMLNMWIMMLHGAFWHTKFPTVIPTVFREQIQSIKADGLTKLLVNLVHAHDEEANAIPSMHCALAVYASFLMYPFYPTFAMAFPLLIAFSCLTCKQHMLIDILPGFLLGALHGWLNRWMSGV